MRENGTILAIFSGIFWGFNGPCIEYLSKIKHVNTDAIIGYRFLIAGAILLILSYFRSLLTREIFINKTHLKDLVLFSILGIFFAQYFYFYGVMLSNSAIATIIQFSAPVFIILIVCKEEHRMPSAKEILAFLLVFIGAFLLVTNARFDRLLITPVALLFCILSMVGFVANSIIPRKINAIYSPVFVLGLAIFTCGVVFYISKQIWQIDFGLDFSSLIVFSVIIVFGTILPFIFYMSAVNKIGANNCTILSSSVPIIATLISHFWLGSSLENIQIIGFILIFAAIMLIVFKRQRF